MMGTCGKRGGRPVEESLASASSSNKFKVPLAVRVHAGVMNFVAGVCKYCLQAYKQSAVCRAYFLQLGGTRRRLCKEGVTKIEEEKYEATRNRKRDPEHTENGERVKIWTWTDPEMPGLS
jgi:hypothetical protein